MHHLLEQQTRREWIAENDLLPNEEPTGVATSCYWKAMPSIIKMENQMVEPTA